MNTSMFLDTIDLVELLLNDPSAPEEDFWGAPRASAYRHRQLKVKQEGMTSRMWLDLHSANPLEFRNHGEVLVTEYFLVADSEGKHVKSYRFPRIERVGELKDSPFGKEWEIFPFQPAETDFGSEVNPRA